MINTRDIAVVYLKELKDSLRDRRTIMSMIIVPTFVMPLLIFGATSIMGKVMKQARAEATSLVLLGGDDSPTVVAALKADPKFRIVKATEDYKQMVSEKRVRLAVEIPTGFETALADGKPSTVTLYHYEGEMKSGIGVAQVEHFFQRWHDKTVEARLTARGLPASLIDPFTVKQQNVAPPEKVGGNVVGGLVPYLIIILCFTGAMYPAIDLTAGEKERGTMETLLCSPVHRISIVLGKLAMVMTASLATITLTLVSSTVSLFAGASLYGGREIAEASAKASRATPFLVDPAGLLGVFAMVVPVAILFSAVLLTIALFAKSYKEAQSYVSPLIIVILMPAMIGMLPGIELDVQTALIPILNLSLACKEMLSGVWHWPFLALIFGSTLLYSGIAITLCVRMFNRESVIFRS